MKNNHKIDLLRFTTAGSVDDGKSTLIGRLLYDSKSIFDDQLEAIKKTSKQRGNDYIDLSLLTDGLRAEREQGITIDVAYRYFATPRRKFIVADTPGHVQYTRNMITGASTSNLAIILIDARKGMLEQTCRHTFIASLLQIKHIVVCVNKMDLVDYSEEVFETICNDYLEFTSKLSVPDIQFIPVSALKGDNVVNQSENMPWYKGLTLLYTLEHINLTMDYNRVDSRFPVQLVIRPQKNQFADFRAYAGRVEAGVFKPGDEIMTLPSGLTSRIKEINTAEKKVEEAFSPMCVEISLEDDIDISRGDMLIKINNKPNITQDLEVLICWLNVKPLTVGTKYLLRHTTNEARCIVKEVRYKININTLHRIENDFDIKTNDLGRVSIRSTKPLFTDTYQKNKGTGSIILVDEFTNETVAAGLII
jgi:sulfate adenylyltransferase subunit 1